MLSIVSEPVSRMEDTQIIDILNIALLEVKTESKFFSEEMYCIQCLSLCLCYRRNISGTL